MESVLRPAGTRLKLVWGATATWRSEARHTVLQVLRAGLRLVKLDVCTREEWTRADCVKAAATIVLDLSSFGGVA